MMNVCHDKLTHEQRYVKSFIILLKAQQTKQKMMTIV